MKVFNILPSESASFISDPVWFFMPDSTILRSGNPFFVPEFDDRFEAFPALAIKINRLGKSIAPRFVHRYFCEASFAMTVRARTLLDKLRSAGMPWTPAVNFDKSCLLGDFADFNSLSENGINLRIGDETVSYPLDEMMSRIENVISRITSDTIIKTGDIVLLPLSADGFHLKPGINIEATVGDSKLLEIRIK